MNESVQSRGTMKAVWLLIVILNGIVLLDALLSPAGHRPLAPKTLLGAGSGLLLGSVGALYPPFTRRPVAVLALVLALALAVWSVVVGR